VNGESWHGGINNGGGGDSISGGGGVAAKLDLAACEKRRQMKTAAAAGSVTTWRGENGWREMAAAMWLVASDATSLKRENGRRGSASCGGALAKAAKTARTAVAAGGCGGVKARRRKSAPGVGGGIRRNGIQRLAYLRGVCSVKAGYLANGYFESGLFNNLFFKWPSVPIGVICV